MLGSRGFVTDGAARGEAKLAWAIPSRDRGRQLVKSLRTRKHEDENDNENTLNPCKGINR